MAPLAPGESVLVIETIALAHPVLIAHPLVGPSGDNGPFLVWGFDEPFASRLITATS